MLKEGSVRGFMIVSSLFLLLWVIGFGLALTGAMGSSEVTPQQTEIEKEVDNDGTLTVVALGDSLTRGTGDATGKGYIGYIRNELEDRVESPIQFVNLAINGQRSNDLKKQLKESEVQRQLSQADLMVMTIGGNDLFRGGETLLDPSPTVISDLQTTYLDNMKSILQDIRAVNELAPIYFIGLYNPFHDLQEGEETSSIVREWNYQTEKVVATYGNVVFVPTFDIFQVDLEKYIYSDRFHPNTEGHKYIGERVSDLLPW